MDGLTPRSGAPSIRAQLSVVIMSTSIRRVEPSTVPFAVTVAVPPIGSTAPIADRSADVSETA